MALEGWIARTQIKQTAAIKPWIQDEHWFVIVLQKLKLEPLPEREEMLERQSLEDWNENHMMKDEAICILKIWNGFLLAFHSWILIC